MKYYMAFQYEDINKGWGIRQVIGFTKAKSPEEARNNMKHLGSSSHIEVGIMEISSKKELIKYRNQLIDKINYSKETLQTSEKALLSLNKLRK